MCLINGTSVHQILKEKKEVHPLTYFCRFVVLTLGSTIPVVGADGKPRKLTDDKYITRIWQFLSENMGKSKTRIVTQTSITDLGNRLDALYELASKGVHDDIPVEELNQCVIQTYLLMGDVLRVREGTS